MAARGAGARYALAHTFLTVRSNVLEVSVIVPELPADIAELKRQVGVFIEAEVYPVEQRIVERNAIDPAEIDELRVKARAAGFAMLNMPAELGGRDLSMLGQVALEEESGKATNGLGFAVVDRGPRELLELLTPAQIEKYVLPIVRGEYREAWALTEPGAGSDLAALAATARSDGDEWVLNGEKWFVTSEGDAGFYLVAAVVDGEQELFIVDPGTPGMVVSRDAALPPRPVSRPPSRARAHRLQGARPRTGSRAATPAPASGSSSSGSSSPPAAAALRNGCSGRPPPGPRSVKRSAARSSATRASRSRSPTRLPSFTPRG